MRFRAIVYRPPETLALRHCTPWRRHNLPPNLQTSVPVAGQIFSDTRCRGFSLSRWSEQRSVEETRALVSDALEAVMAGAFRLEGTREFPLTEAVAAVEAAARIPSGGPVLLRA